MQTLDSIQQLLSNQNAVMLYFSSPGCGVCQVLKPKLTEALIQEYPAFHIESIDISANPEIASHFTVFAIPTVLVFFEGKEFVRKSRNMSVGEVIESLRRPYTLMVGN